MDHQDFDNILRNKLKQLKDAGQTTPDWGRMESEILEDNLKDQAFDSQIKRKLADIKVGHYNTNNWSLLYELIDKRIKNKQAVFAYKFIEISLVLLLVVTSFNLGFLDNPSDHKASEYTTTLQIASVQVDVQDRDKNQDVAAQFTNSSQSPENTTRTKLATPLTEFKISNTSNRIPITKLTPTFDENLNSNSKSVISQENQFALSIKANSQKEELEMNTIDNSNSDVPDEVRLLTFMTNHKATSGEALPPLDLEVLSVENITVNFDKVTAKKPLRWFASVQSGYQFNKINSDVYESIVRGRNGVLLPSESNIKQSMNAAFAVELGKTIGDFDVSIGTGYQHVEYNPALNLTTGNITSKYTETSVESIGYQLLSIPLNIRWKALSWRSWNASLQGSLISTILVKSNQRIRQRLIQGDRIQFVAQNEIDYSTLDYEFAQGLSDEPASLPTGLLNNYFLRGSLGGEISKKITPSTSLFGTYNYIFNLPVKSQKFENADMINSQYFGIGVRRYVG